MRRRRIVLVAALGLVTLCSSCAYYNTFFLARKYYDRGTGGAPYPVDKVEASAGVNFTRAIDYSKKVIAQYPKSKWVDDAYLLWARALLGRDDPLQAVKLLEDFPAQFPKSGLRNQAQFYLGVAYRQARKYREALRALDGYLAAAPKGDLAPYAHLERARALMSLDRPAEAAQAAGVVLERYPKSPLLYNARLARAEALLAAGDQMRARADFRVLGERARTDDERLGFLLREADCLESARDYDGELALLDDALSHEKEPLPPDTTGGRAPVVRQTPGYDRYGRILIRIGGVHLLAGRLEQALVAFNRVAEDYPRTAIGAEAQYRIGYAYEVIGDDFDRARLEYGKVRDQGGGTIFGVQASQRMQSLERLAKYRESTGDSLNKKAEAEFLLAEVYLFQQDNSQRALEEYRRIARDFPGTEYEAKALTAQAWVLSRKLDQRAAADTLLWRVVYEFPATEAQIAARDYLEGDGYIVPSELIKFPEVRLAQVEPVPALTPPPEVTPGPGPPSPVPRLEPGAAPQGLRAGAPPPGSVGPELPPGLAAGLDSLGFAPMSGDSLRATAPYPEGAPRAGTSPPGGAPPAGTPAPAGPPRAGVAGDSTRVSPPAARDSSAAPRDSAASGGGSRSGP